MARHKISSAALLIGAAMSVASAVSAETFRWAGTTDPQTMDPHAVNAAPVLSFLNNVYEGLVRRNGEMAVEPSLATSWEPLPEGAGWRFMLREGVTFHDGAEFNADDVLFSYERAVSETSDVKSWFASVTAVEKVDDYTVDFKTSSPNPLFPGSIANFMILDSGWAEANDATAPARESENFATRNANGTGPFRLTARDPGVETRLAPNDGWWDSLDSNVTEAVWTPIGNAATGLAALLSGEIDFISPIPLQDVEQVEGRDGFKVLSGLETRVIMLGFGHDHDTLKYSDETTDKNPFQDPRVRLSVAQAVDVATIDRVIMRGASEPASQLLPEGLSGWSEAHPDRPAFDADAAKAMLEEAGYPDGFSFGLMCPNDRYINDEALCRAVASMLAKIGVTAKVNAMPVRGYWDELRADNFDMYLLGWSPGTFDAEHPIRFLAHTPGERLGTWNFGGYSNARIDELLEPIQSEVDPAARQAMIDEVAGILQDEVAYVPLYTQPLIWAMKDSVDVVQRPDNFFLLRWVSVN
ncbi:ABC transporter substrate-binding protein [Palleronia caenipelagi]|uniref:ABC transporter substrate-binding protein n=1 Tax=Palleronia caenipelagi TaxID=2489174 RepID=A0A547PUM3_9RHOB|nr:ABC transporter substrate-binding protein [Palleronia caenipelagi]TRD17846.1 ABC transporter substrate-binding protein [Palleronia caenipelagi]